MSADLARLKQGQRPQVFEVKKQAVQNQKITPPQQTPVPKSIPLVPQLIKPVLPPLPTPPRPAFKPTPAPTVPLTTRPSPSQSFKPSPRPTTQNQEMVTPPPLDTQPFITSKDSEHHHKERIISTDSLPGFLGEPVPKKTAKLPEEKVEYGLIARVIGSGMTTGIVSTVIVAVVTYFLITYFVFNQEEEIVLTPTPTQTGLAPTPIVNELETIFRATATDNFYTPESQEKTVPEFISFIKNKVLVKKEFRKVNFILPSGQVINKTSGFTDILDILSVKYPANFKDMLNTNQMILFYGQEESFNDNLPASEVPKRIVFIVEVEDISKILDLMRRWEPTIAQDIKDVLELDPTKRASQNFLDNQHQGTMIRYQNFPFPDKSIDYAVVSSLTDKHYLIITNSRESAYSPIDKIKGL